MARYGMDYGRRGGVGRGDREQSFQQRGGFGGMNAGRWGDPWQGERGRFGGGWQGRGGMGAHEGYQGYERGPRYGGGYDRDWGGQQEWGMQGGGYGMGYGARDMGYEMGGYGTDRSSIGARGGGQSSRNMRAAEIMTENPACVTPDTSLHDVAQKMKDLNVGIIPVVEDMQSRRLRGVITDRDIAVRAVAAGKGADTRVSECMTADVETVNKNDSVHEVLEVMRGDQVRRVPVTDREGRLVGIIAQADVAVDWGGEGQGHRRMVADTLESISEPARPRRGAMQAGGRGQAQTGGSQEQGQMQAGTARQSATQGRSSRSTGNAS